MYTMLIVLPVNNEFRQKVIGGDQFHNHSTRNISFNMLCTLGNILGMVKADYIAYL